MEFTHTQLNLYFYLTAAIGLGLGGFVLYWFGKRAYIKMRNQSQGRYNNITKTYIVSSREIGIKVLWYMMPGVLLFVLLCFPMFFFMGQLKKWNYCVEMIQADKSLNIQKNDPDIIQRCNCLDKDELFKAAENPNSK